MNFNVDISTSACAKFKLLSRSSINVVHFDYV